MQNQKLKIYYIANITLKPYGEYYPTRMLPCGQCLHTLEGHTDWGI